jgi:adenylylsulfate kinase
MSAERGLAVWLTGLPASGKTIIGESLETRLHERGIRAALLDSDDLRRRLMPEAGYTSRERERFYAELVELAVLISEHGVNVIIAATAHLQRYRDAARARIERFAEVHVVCDPAVCRQRDPKGLWRRADQGQIDFLPGANVPYEPPRRPEAIVNSAVFTPAQAAEVIERTLEEAGLLTRTSAGSDAAHAG